MEDRFWFVGNDVAVDFANTVIGRDLRPEALQDWDDVLEFFVRSRVLSEPEAKRVRRQTEREHAQADAHAAAVSLRDAVRDLIAGLAAGRPLRSELVRRLNVDLAAAATCPRLTRKEEGWRLEDLQVDESWKGALGRVARAAAGLAERPAGSIRKCANAACGLYFRDASQAQARRWCSMAVCGNRAKVAAHARRTARRSLRQESRLV